MQDILPALWESVVPLGSDVARDTITETLSCLWGRKNATGTSAMER